MWTHSMHPLLTPGEGSTIVANGMMHVDTVVTNGKCMDEAASVEDTIKLSIHGYMVPRRGVRAAPSCRTV